MLQPVRTYDRRLGRLGRLGLVAIALAAALASGCIVPRPFHPHRHAVVAPPAVHVHATPGRHVGVFKSHRR